MKRRMLVSCDRASILVVEEFHAFDRRYRLLSSATAILSDEEAFDSDSMKVKGIQRIRALPDLELEALWTSIVTESGFKDRLVGQAVLNFTLRRRVKRSVVPLHGVILLTGEPGTGKTSLARGLASRIASILSAAKGFRLLEVEPHALTSSAMGRTQRAVSDLFAQAIAEAAAAGPTVVLLDEVETLAADRAKLSLEANPIDVHRATDAVLVQLDALAEAYPDLLFVATSNFPAGRSAGVLLHTFLG